jgi:hypothetical protein
MPAPRTEHDPLCPWPALSQHPNHCQCDLIARVRADERSEMAAVIDREVIADEVREQIAQKIEAIPVLPAQIPQSVTIAYAAEIARATA